MSRDGRRSLVGALIASLAIGAAVRAAEPEPSRYYAGPRFYPRSARWDPFQLRKHLYPALKEAGIRRIEVVAGTASIVQERSASGMMYLDGLPAPALHAVLQMLPAEYTGAEVDFLVQGSGTEADPDRMWTARRDLEGGILILQGGPPLALEGPDPSPEELAARFGIGPLLDSSDARWSESERRALQKALELLSPRELELVAGVSFMRAKVQSQGRAAEYGWGGEGVPGSIRVFDRAFELDGGRPRYVGAPEQAVPYAVLLILHEVGHVIADEERRRVRAVREERSERRAVRADRYRAQRQDYIRDSERAAGDAELVQQLQRSRAELEVVHAELAAELQVIQALDLEIDRREVAPTSIERTYAGLPGALAGPTPYGRGSAAESFSEAFALYHLDPESLRWIAPEAHAWFAASAHLEIPEAAQPDVAAAPTATPSATEEPAPEP